MHCIHMCGVYNYLKYVSWYVQVQHTSVATMCDRSVPVWSMLHTSNSSLSLPQRRHVSLPPLQACLPSIPIPTPAVPSALVFKLLIGLIDSSTQTEEATKGVEPLLFAFLTSTITNLVKGQAPAS